MDDNSLSDLAKEIDEEKHALFMRIMNTGASREVVISIMHDVDRIADLSKCLAIRSCEPEHIKIADECGIG